MISASLLKKLALNCAVSTLEWNYEIMTYNPILNYSCMHNYMQCIQINSTIYNFISRCQGYSRVSKSHTVPILHGR